MRIEHPELSLFGITRLAECCQTVIIRIFLSVNYFHDMSFFMYLRYMYFTC